MGLKMRIVIAAAVFFALGLQAASASDLETLAEEGYGVIEKTSVMGEYEGCDFDRHIPLADGLVFICEGYDYTYAYDPDVLILKNVKTGDIKVIIDDDEEEGTLVQVAK
jgi:hypothetical protein